jgi:hypothetical protein
MINPFLAAEQQDRRRTNPNYLRYCQEGRSKFDGITLDQKVLVGVKGEGHPEGRSYEEVQGQLIDLGAYVATLNTGPIELHKVARVTLLEEPNPFF